MAEASARTKGKALVVVESPAKAKTIEQYLGKGFTVRASMGHVRDLPTKELGVDLEEDLFQPKYVAIRSKSKVVKELKKAASAVDTVYLATDPDREGEAIAWHVAKALGEEDPVNSGRFRRMSFNEITRSAVTRALEETGSIDGRKVEAQQARRVLDRLVGYQVSPLLWKALYRGLSAGRVQSVALRLISEREAEIEAFDPQEYWTIEALFGTEVDGEAATYGATLDEVDGEDIEIGDEAEAGTLLEAARRETYRITSVEKRDRKRNPPPAFITSTLQQEAARKLGFSAKKTMTVAQQLYEGVDVPGVGSVGMITYMRTDSVRVADSALEAARKRILGEYGREYLPEKPRHYKGRKGAQDAHEAIRPTGLERPPSEAEKYLNRDQARLYELIWNRFLAHQMLPAEYEGTTVLTRGGAYTFKSTGSVLTFPGYLAVYQEGTDEEEEDERDLPAGLVEGLDASLEEMEGDQHFTK
ncbi:MAG: type I DNA topoisomerase, partial [bacterium]